MASGTQVKAEIRPSRARFAGRHSQRGHRSGHQYGMALQDYVLSANERVTVMLQIEHIDAVPHIAEILAVPGVGAIVIGPYDLSASMGLPGQYAHPDVASVIAKLAEACNHTKVPWGAFSPDAESAKTQIARGATLIALGTDTMHLWKGARSALADVRQAIPG